MGATLLGWFPALLRALWPRQTQGEDDRHFQWRCAVTALGFVIALGTSFHIAAACGWLKPFYPGFAQETALEDTNDLLLSILKKDLKRDIKDNRGAECAAQNKGDWVARDYARGAKEQDEDEWFQRFKTAAREPSCVEALN